jgi:2,4-dienoyl-CoA reductase-like NADH-dependent reductase (Old Yellow Enzyme family)
MPNLFDPVTIGTMIIRNHLMRSATAERMADPQDGTPTEGMQRMYSNLAEGGIGLIVTGHAYIERQGKAHPEMASIATDEVIPAWRDVIIPAQKAGARMMLQVNHCGASCDPNVTPYPVSPAGVPTNDLVTPQPMTNADLDRIVTAFGQAAKRARGAGFDGVQIHGAHGYLLNQFLCPFTYPDPSFFLDGVEATATERRCKILKAVIEEMRSQVGNDYPLWIKLGVAGRTESGMTLEEGAQIAEACSRYGVDCIELSHALGIPEEIDQHADVTFLPFAEVIRPAVGDDFPLALVHSFRTRAQMQSILDRGTVQMVSMCRPLVAEPDLPIKLRTNPEYEHACVRCGLCWPKPPQSGVACYNKAVQRKLAENKS